ACVLLNLLLSGKTLSTNAYMRFWQWSITLDLIE
ncbi:MAG: hypothetical protein ACJAZA_002231, partial [Shewanella psychromarinicola]